ncbi:baseplate tail tube cap [Phage C48C1]|nr:baseplate tail tube cap [Phage C48C1]
MAIEDNEIKLNLNAGKPLTGSQINVSAYGGTDFLEEYKETVETVKEILDNASDPSTTITHKYPVEQEDRYGASVIFKTRKIIPPGPTNGGQALIDKLKPDPEISKLTKEAKSLPRGDAYNPDDHGGKSREEKVKELATQAEKKRQEKIEAAGGIEYTDRAVEYAGINIKLYLPVAYQQNDSFNIATPELGQIGAAAAAAASGGKGMLSAGMEAMGRGASTIIDLVTGGLAGDAARLGAAQMAGRVPIVGAELGQAAQISGAVTVNPNLRSAFRGVGLREFSFTFKFLARSQREAQMVESIIRSFREFAYPESIELGGISGGYKYPHMFEIVVKHEPTGKRVGSKIKDCFLRSIATNYNPSSMAFHADGRPVEIDLSLNFVEEVTLSRKDIQDEF